jgi:predicted nucleotide-binding protein
MKAQENTGKYYHMMIESKNIKDLPYLYEYDMQSLERIYKIIKAYANRDEFRFKGYVIDYNKIKRIVIKCSNELIKNVLANKQCQSESESNGWIHVAWTKNNLLYSNDNIDGLTDLTDELLNEIQTIKPVFSNSQKDMTKVFIVHGHDDALKQEVARFIEKLALTPIILHEQINAGRTIIEKIEEYSNVGYGIVLYTPCDRGGENKNDAPLNQRARQNVVLEHGYLLAKLGRKNVMALVKDDIEYPSDIGGIVYAKYDTEWKLQLLKELNTAGYKINLSLAI